MCSSPISLPSQAPCDEAFYDEDFFEVEAPAMATGD